MNAAPNAFPDLSKLTGDLYRQWEQSMSTWWDQVVENPTFLTGMTDQVARMAEARTQYEEAVDRGLENLHLPTRRDLVRLARVATLLEERLLTQEDQVLSLQDKVAGLEREVVQARLEAAEARLEAREQHAALIEKLAALEARLSGSPAPVEQAPTEPSPRRRR